MYKSSLDEIFQGLIIFLLEAPLLI